MISKKLSEQIISLGCEYKDPKGGIAQVLKVYEDYVYNNFQFIVNSKVANKYVNIKTLIYALYKLYITLLLNRKIRIVHIHTASYNSFLRSSLFIRLSKLMKRKVIIHIHGGGFKEYYKLKPNFVSAILNKCDSIITLTISWKEFFQRITTCKNIYVVNNVISPPIFLDKKNGDNKKHLLFLGLITEKKGIYDLIDVIAQNKYFFENKIVLHIGGNGEIERLTNLIENKNLQDIIIYEGWVSGEKKIKLLNLADAFILPSYVEGLPVSILEAMSYGLIILTTPVGGIPEIITDATGVFFNPGNKEQLTNVLYKYVNNKYDGMGKQAQIVASRYFPNSVEKQLINIYNNLIYNDGIC